MKKIVLILTLIGVSSVFAFAQDDYKKGEFYGGFSRTQADINSGGDDGFTPSGSEGFNGFEAAGVYNVSRYVGIKGDVSGAYNKQTFDISLSGNGTTPQVVTFETRTALYNILGGVQIKDNSSEKRLKPFAHALVGAGIARFKFEDNGCRTGQICGTNSFDDTRTGVAGAFGGGLDIKLSNRIDLRAIQVDYNPMRIDGGTLHNVRLGIGLVFK